MHISPIDPIAPAWNHMVRILFQPFEFKKWMLLGFCAFLSQCGEGGGNSGNWSNWSNSNNQQGYGEAKQWIESNLELVIGLVVGVIALSIIVALFVTWISSRGKFMLLDGIVKNRGAVSEPWTEYKTEANSLFLFRIVVGLIAIVGFLVRRRCSDLDRVARYSNWNIQRSFLCCNRLWLFSPDSIHHRMHRILLLREVCLSSQRCI